MTMPLYLLGTLFVIVCVLLIIVVLLQKGRGGGLGAAFGGAGSSAFGTRIGDVFTWVTIVLTALFLILALVTTVVFRPDPDQVAAPTFSPMPAGVPDWTKPFGVQIDSTTLEARIYYTLDGSEPTEESTLYEDMPVQIERGTTLKARAYRGGGWTPSLVREMLYEPVTAATQPAENGLIPAVEGESIPPIDEAIDNTTEMADEAAGEEAPAEDIPAEVPAN